MGWLLAESNPDRARGGGTLLRDLDQLVNGETEISTAVVESALTASRSAPGALERIDRLAEPRPATRTCQRATESRNAAVAVSPVTRRVL